MKLRSILTAFAVAAAFAGPAVAADVICYNCPPEWADWGTMLKSIKADLGLDVPHDNKNSGQTLSTLIADKANPVADIAYFGVTFGIKAKEAGVVAPYQPANIKDIPAGLKADDGSWFAIHYGTIGFFVNVDALRGVPVPKSWKDLLEPRYQGLVGYLDPTSAAVGYAAATAANLALGGSLDNWRPGIDFFKALKKNRPIVPLQTAYARVLSGEIPIMFDYDFNTMRAKYKDKCNCVFVIPQEGTIVLPYVMSLVKNGPHPANARKVLDYLLSDKGQAIWTNAFLRPIRPAAMPPDVAAKFLPAEEYKRARVIDYAKMEAGQNAFRDLYQKEVR
ncbi:MAG: extracellular solute-binding protein [candidate division NC10 bacterium]|nr:extracellular solute-binding protein [candidate division NC10 bacterium]MBI2454888.1 extracellular solute-binding protein [candidate division NC10 bacterium]